MVPESLPGPRRRREFWYLFDLADVVHTYAQTDEGDEAPEAEKHEQSKQLKPAHITPYPGDSDAPESDPSSPRPGA